jgi:hypothetical protein
MGQASAKCIMCGKDIAISDKPDDKSKSERDQQEAYSLHITIEQIDGTSYTFDTADCALMFKRFRSVYGSNFADE